MNKKKVVADILRGNVSDTKKKLKEAARTFEGIKLSPEAFELMLDIDNQSVLGKQKSDIFKHLQTRKIAGVYDRKEAAQAYMYLIGAAARDYVKRWKVGMKWDEYIEEEERFALAKVFIKQTELQLKIGI